ncbi:MAG: heme-binding protein [Paracoccaceae bacterium]|nr:heme-binding protein [Paracoccaceae bacterium]
MFGGEAADEPEYRVIEQDGDIEIREYAGFAVAKTTVMVPFDQAIGAGFRRLFDYISGGNQSEAKIEMTAPVLTEPKGEKIAMTAPVLAQPGNEMREVTASSLTPEGDESWTIAFVLPEGLTATSAPTPADPTVTLRDIPSRRVASIRFSGRFRNATAEMKRQFLADWLASRGLSHDGDWRIAGYNPPWTIPALRRNEVLVTLE